MSYNFKCSIFKFFTLFDGNIFFWTVSKFGFVRLELQFTLLLFRWYRHNEQNSSHFKSIRFKCSALATNVYNKDNLMEYCFCWEKKMIAQRMNAFRIEWMPVLNRSSTKQRLMRMIWICNFINHIRNNVLLLKRIANYRVAVKYGKLTREIPKRK